MVGAAKALFVPMALSVGFSMIASYILSSTLVPVLTVWLVRAHSEKEIATARFPLWSGLGVVFRIVDDHAASNHDTLPRNDSCFTVTLAGTGGIEKKGLKLSWRRVNRGATVQFQRYQLRRVYVDLFRS